MTESVPHQTSRVSSRWLWGTLAVGILLRVAAVIGTEVFPTVANTWDSHFYHETAGALSQGEGFQFQGRPTAFFPPGYPAALAGAYALLGRDPRSGQWANVVFSLLVLAFTSAWAGRSWGGDSARRCAVFLALEPSQIIMPAFLMSEVFCAAGLAAALFFSTGTSWLSRGAAGLATVAAGFTRGHAFLISPAVIFFRTKAGRSTVYSLAVVLLLSGAGVLLWASRNESQLGKPVLVATNAGINLWLGNNPNAQGGRADPPGGVPDTEDELFNERVSRERAWEFIRTHPLRTAALLPMKVFRLWGFGPGLTYRAEIQAKWGRVPGLGVMAVTQLVHMGLMLWLTVKAWRRRRGGPWGAGDRSVMVLAAVWTLGHLPFLGGARYLFPIYSFLVAAAAASPADGQTRPV